MTKNPDKWIRKGIEDALGNAYPLYDTRVTGGTVPKNYIILHTQTKVETLLNKCNSQWDCTIVIDLVTRLKGTGNPGDRTTLNDMEELVIFNMQSLTIEGFSIFRMYLESSTPLDNVTNTENVFRQLVRYRLLLNEID